MQDTLLDVPLGKQFDSQSRPHIVGPDLRGKLFAAQNNISLKIDKIFVKFWIISAVDTIFKMAENIIPALSWNGLICRHWNMQH